MFCMQAQAQLVPLASQYYFNRYLGNPAFAGSTEGFKGNLAYRSQFNSVEGSPVTGAFTGEYGFNNRVGIGATVFTDKAGLLRRTRAVATYAYHLPVAQGETLHFGLSGGISTERLNTSNLQGDMSDPSIARFNNSSASIDGDFGIAYTNSALTIQAMLPNMRQLFKKEITNTVNWAVFYTAISYKLPLGDDGDGTLEPLAALRGVKGGDQIFDIGANLAMLNNNLMLNAMYHTSKNATLGLGVNVASINSAVMVNYTLNTAGMNRFGNSNVFQVGLRVDLKRED
ncbi:hypothetical protein BC343_14430 [Mucilaginibacter pedocola]|uniref:Type IX secretion system membrane protein PorP/SprF n=2 Tax=Mucilaginibacter pedocola TaxID=1792845 RepID=A0A1S9P943_9SPHI|nr:hypothetical protein BC343_14430 [Mucilaginibacter pedocola]